MFTRITVPLMLLSVLAAADPVGLPPSPVLDPAPVSSLYAGMVPGTATHLPAGIAIACDKKSPVGEPETIDRLTTPDLDMICTRQHSADGATTFLRTVLAIRGELTVVVDHVLPAVGDTAEHTIVRRITLPAETKRSGDAILDTANLRVQSVDTATLALDDGAAVLIQHAAGAIMACTVIQPLAAGKTPVGVDAIASAVGAVRKLHLRYDQGRQEDVCIAWESRPLHVAGVAYFGRVAHVRTSGKGIAVTVMP
jgi:hypothetical protein